MPPPSAAKAAIPASSQAHHAMPVSSSSGVVGVAGWPCGRAGRSRPPLVVGSSVSFAGAGVSAARRSAGNCGAIVGVAAGLREGVGVGAGCSVGRVAGVFVALGAGVGAARVAGAGVGVGVGVRIARGRTGTTPLSSAGPSTSGVGVELGPGGSEKVCAASGLAASDRAIRGRVDTLRMTMGIRAKAGCALNRL